MAAICRSFQTKVLKNFVSLLKSQRIDKKFSLEIMYCEITWNEKASEATSKFDF